MTDIESSIQSQVDDLESLLKESLAATTTPRSELQVSSTAPTHFLESLEYSFGGSAKRFRPILLFMVAQSLDLDLNLMRPLAASIEMVHTSSLIHDDLPCMDDAPTRRSQPSHHKTYGEPAALLAGNALVSQAFLMISKNYIEGKAGDLICALAQAYTSMIYGQFLDMSLNSKSTAEECLEVYGLKTGELIAFCTEAPAIMMSAEPSLRQELRKFGQALGLCFQLKDDLLDESDGGHREEISYLSICGAEMTKKQLEYWKEEAYRHLESIPHSESLKKIVNWAEVRTS